MNPYGTCIAVGAFQLWALTFGGAISRTSAESFLQVCFLIATYVLTDYGIATAQAPVAVASNFTWCLSTCLLTHLELDRLERFVLRTKVARYLTRAYAILVCLVQVLLPVYTTSIWDPMLLTEPSIAILTAASILTCTFDILCDLLVIQHVILNCQTATKWKVVSKQALALLIYAGALAFGESWDYMVDRVSGWALWATVDVAAVFSYMCMYKVLLEVVAADRSALSACAKTHPSSG
ncbi:hypothetical protein HK101_006910 [Irineochytrium annulatum]|nr:hypothetical protein HK101_006910 [Irineochytrium annulatum]